MRRALIALLVATGCAAAQELKLEKDVKLATLLGEGNWEASGVEVVGDSILIVLDDDPRLIELDPALSKAELVSEGLPSAEGIAFDAEKRRVFVVSEEEEHGREWHPRLRELDQELRPVGEPVWLPLEVVGGENKGIEGLAFVRRGDKDHLLCLYEGNHGKAGKQGKDKGHGLIAVLAREEKGWKEVAKLELGPGAPLEDYAGLDVDGDRIAVVSQASAKVWIGTLAKDAWKVDAGKVWSLPRGFARCEGIAFLDAKRLVICSDAAKPDEVADHDKSVHIFSLPD